MTSLATATICFPVIHNSISELRGERVASLCEMATQTLFAVKRHAEVYFSLCDILKNPIRQRFLFTPFNP